MICFTLAANPFTIVLKNVMEDFHAGRDNISIALSILTIAAGISGLFLGTLITRHRQLRFLIGGVILDGLTFITLGLIPNLWWFYLLYFISGVATSGAGFIPIFTILSK